jgi:hypothetical protein
MNEEYEVIPYGFNEDGDLVLHGDTGFCPLFPCPCHEDQDLIGGVNDQYQDGLVTGQEATNITEGRNI